MKEENKPFKMSRAAKDVESILAGIMITIWMITLLCLAFALPFMILGFIF